ncbi:protein kinase [Oceanithermus sp.]|uniref:protein kinase domain-containing protein n=1 Tax=Oceanithermus sp. TaxID=2268145 RepID=UPI0025CD3698|nr:protein kinase [Oceanithermus sp.]
MIELVVALSLFLLTLVLALRLNVALLGLLTVGVVGAEVALLGYTRGLVWQAVGWGALGLVAYPLSLRPRARARRGGRRSRRSRSSRARRNPTLHETTAPELEKRYEILDRIGIGGMASVYKARRRSDGRMVALKIPQDKFVSDTRFVKRFHREAEVLQKLKHPNIVRVYDHGAFGDTHYIAMEFLDGEELDRLIENRRLTVPAAINIMRHVADALRHIHAQGIIHRDIKPGNIMVLRGAIGEDGRIDPKGVRLMDFGIAAGKVLTRLTITGARIGTPVYMSPEQAKGQRIDHRSDIYSLGIVFYESLTGQAPFQGGYESVIHQQIYELPTPPKQLNPEIPPPINDLIMRMLAKEADKRPSLDEVIEKLKGKFKDTQELDRPFYLAVAAEAKRGSIRLLEPDGTPLKLFSGVGSAPGMFASPPLDLATDREGHIWISVFEYGSGQSRMVHRFDPEGKLVASIGPYGVKPGEFLYPASLTSSDLGELLVLDSENHTIQRFDLAGRPLGRFGGKGAGKGLFDTPRKIVASRHFLYVLDYGNRQVQRLTLEGRYLSRFAFRKSKGSDELRVLSGLGIDEADQLYIFDADAQKIRKLNTDGRVILSLPLPTMQNEDPLSLVDIVVDPQGIVYAARRGSTRIQRFAPDGDLLEPIEVYAPVRGLELWKNPRPEHAPPAPEAAS